VKNFFIALPRAVPPGSHFSNRSERTQAIRSFLPRPKPYFEVTWHSDVVYRTRPGRDRTPTVAVDGSLLGKPLF
jgi:hypothetical protein